MDKAISFKDPLVLAIERGEKTQTRRLAASQPQTPGMRFVQDPAYPEQFLIANEAETINTIACPYPVGSTLWVKQRLVRAPSGYDPIVRYGTDMLPAMRDGAPVPWPWKPRTLGAMYCPRWASRLTLEVESVRVERLGDITEADILAEGVTVPLAAKLTGIPWSSLPTLHHAWEALWDSINGKREGASWDANPWIWRITFRRVDAAPVSA